MRFTEQVAIVTGAASGIGAATARRLSREGAKLVVVDLNKQGLGELNLDGPCLRIVADMADADAVADTVEQAVARFGEIDVLVANAGIWQQRRFLDVSIEEWDRIMHVNLRGTFLVCHRVARTMVAAEQRGAIVITASTNSSVAEVDMAHYNSSKGGVLMLAKSMAVDLAGYGIRVNAVAPGTTRTPMIQAALDALPASMSESLLPPIARWGEPEDCAAAIAFLASSDAEYVTGATLVVDGGQTALIGQAR